MDTLNRWLTLFANLGVLAGTLLLAYEINENRNLQAAQTRLAITDINRDMVLRFSENPTAVNALLKIESGESLSSEEDLVLRFQAVAAFRHWENVYFQYQNGLFHENEFKAISSTWRKNLLSPRLEGRWESKAATFSTEFEQFIDQLIVEERELRAAH